MSYVPFDGRGKGQKTFYLHDYRWKQHGLALLGRFYPGSGELLDKEMDLIFTLTYNTVSKARGVDTGPFRRAIWYYSLQLYGMAHDDYNYDNVPILLQPTVRTFIRKVACTPLPDVITEADYAIAGYGFEHSEKCHITLLTIEARRQAALLYALHAVMSHMTSDRDSL